MSIYNKTCLMYGIEFNYKDFKKAELFEKIDNYFSEEKEKSISYIADFMNGDFVYIGYIYSFIDLSEDFQLEIMPVNDLHIDIRKNIINQVNKMFAENNQAPFEDAHYMLGDIRIHLVSYSY